jgi:hypothetical protein
MGDTPGLKAPKRGELYLVNFHSTMGSEIQKTSAILDEVLSRTLSTAVEHGMRITFPMLLMSTRDFGDWAQYLPRNPGFM